MTSTTDTAYSINDTIDMMIYTDAQEKYASEGVSYWSCITGVDLRRTEIICCVWMIQVWCGIWFGGNVVYFLEQAGLNSTKSFDFGVGENSIALLGTMCSWLVMRYVKSKIKIFWLF